MGKDGCVLALEPAPHNFRLLKKNIEANSFSNVTALPQAVSDRAAHLSLVLSSVNFGQHHVRQIDELHLQPPTQSVVVESITVDDLVRRHKLRPDFIKMDIEGAECLAFKGMRKTLGDNYEVLILCEFNPSALQRCGANPRDIVRILRDMKFRLFKILQKCLLREISGDELLTTVQKGQNVNILASRRDPEPLIASR